MKNRNKYTDNAVGKTEDSIVEETETKTDNKTKEEFTEHMGELIKLNSTNLSIKGEQQMDFDDSSIREKEFNLNFASTVRQIFQAMDVDIIFDNLEGSFSILDDSCRFFHETDSGTLDISFAMGVKTAQAAEFLVRFSKIADLVNIPIYIEREQYVENQLFCGYDVWSGRYIGENTED